MAITACGNKAEGNFRVKETFYILTGIGITHIYIYICQTSNCMLQNGCISFYVNMSQTNNWKSFYRDVYMPSWRAISCTCTQKLIAISFVQLFLFISSPGCLDSTECQIPTLQSALQFYINLYKIFYMYLQQKNWEWKHLKGKVFSAHKRW